MYVRFIVAHLDPDSGARQGLFQAAATLRRENALTPDERVRLDSIFEWFDVNLKKPARFNRSNRPHRKAKAISWFKSSAKEHIAQVRAIAYILEMHGLVTEMIKTRRPGYTVYEDDFQVAAEPFSETRV
jgi:hypothetical protein